MGLQAFHPTGRLSSRRLWKTVIWCIGAMLIVCAFDLVDLLRSTSWRTVGSLSSDIAVELALLGIMVLVKQSRLRAAAWAIFIGSALFAIITMLILPALTLSCMILPMMGMMLALPYISARELYAQSMISWLTIVAVVLLSEVRWVDGKITLNNFNLLNTAASCMLLGIVLLVINQVHRELSENLEATQAANAALTGARDSLEQTVVERTAELTYALSEVEARSASQAELLAQTARQREVIRGLSSPLLPVSDRTLVLPLIGELDAERLDSVQAQALQAIERLGARTLILDITGALLVDQRVGKRLLDMIQSVRLMGSQTVIVGVRPEVAQTVISLGIDFGDLRVAATLRDGLEIAARLA